MSEYSEYFLNSAVSIVHLELIEISHPSFSQVYRLVRNAYKGVTANIDGVDRAFVYYPLKLTPTGTSDDLEQVIRVDLGDLGEIIPQELDNVFSDGTQLTKPSFRYWVFRSDNLETPIEGPITLEIPSLVSKKEGSSFEARAPSIGINRTGELFRMTRFSSLKGLL